MFRIGEFSKLAKTTAKTLRFYDEKGLLKPSFVDEANGYRYYEAKQLYDLNRIMALRQAGFSIGDIKKTVSGAGSETESICRANIAAIEGAIGELTERLARIRCLLSDMSGQKQAEYQATLKSMPRQAVFFKRGIVPRYADIPAFIAGAMRELGQKKLAVSNPAYSYTAYLDRGYRESDIQVEYAIAVEPPALPDDAVKMNDPALFACVCHKGAYVNFPRAYGYILGWVEQNGYSIAGGIRECYIAGETDTPDADKWVTEIQIPVVKRP